MAQKITEGSSKKGLAARILGGQPTGRQEGFFWLMILSLTLWPICFFASLFFFDAPIQTTVDEISRWGMTLTIWLYPLYLLPLMGLWYRLSKCLRATWLFYLCPLIPVIIFFSFVELASSDYAAKKPEGYDPSTFIRINEAFAKDINHVYFYNEILKDADPKSFRTLDEDYSADSQHVWYREDIIEGADPKTFVAPEKSNSLEISLALAHDDHDYYSQNNPLHVADMAGFKRIDGSWAVDRLNVYFIGIEAEIGKDIVPIGDYTTFRVLNHLYAADAKNVYYKNKIVEGADPKTFVVLKGGNDYGQDKNRVYYEARGTTIRNLDALKHRKTGNGLYETFHTDGKTVYNPELMAMPVGTDFATIHRVERYRDWYADKNRVYYQNRLLPKANPQTFKIFPSHYVSEDYVSNNNKSSSYSCDGNRVYYRDSLMLGVDVASFICGYDYVISQSFAFDKNRYYQGNPNPRLEKLRQGKCRVDSE
ncbi:MAG: DKNYY domain-containing protein [Prevotella sp.]|nr:DKNYY domain-containing protein [Prevotella sp.]